mmetsp:Transcript_472/g.760  ORF Transcript_472/g.760 Transcript_472/m.760 type:complete len:243 (-) Transcript_472:585-1313(-)
MLPVWPRIAFSSTFFSFGFGLHPKMPPLQPIPIHVRIQQNSATHDSTDSQRCQCISERIIRYLATIVFIKDERFIIVVEMCDPCVLVGKSPQIDPIKGWLRQSCRDNIVINLFLCDCAKLWGKFAHTNVHFGNVDREAQLSKTSNLCLDHARRRYTRSASSSGVKMCLNTTAVHRHVFGLEISQELIKAFAFRGADSLNLVVVVQQDSRRICLVRPSKTLFNVGGSKCSQEDIVCERPIWSK